MIPIGLIWSCMKRMPKVFAIMFNLISFTLLLFILISGISKSQDSIYFTDLKFNSKSVLYPIISANFESQYSMGALADISIKPAMSGICLSGLPSAHFNSSTQCYKRSYNLSQIVPDNMQDTESNLYDMLNIQISALDSTSSNATANMPSDLNILKIAHDQTMLIHPSLTIVSLIFQIVSILVLLFTMIPKVFDVSFANSAYTLYATIGVTFLSCCVNGFNGMLVQANADTVKTLVPLSSLHILTVTAGTKLLQMVWASFAMHIVQLLLLGYACYRFLQNLDEEENSETNKSLDEEKGTKSKIKDTKSSIFSSSRNNSTKSNNKYQHNKNHELYSYESDDSRSTYF